MKKTDRGFIKLLRRYQEGKCSGEEKAVIDQWFSAIHHEIADQPLGDKQDEIMERIRANILSGKTGEIDLAPFPRKKIWWQLWPARTAAAGLLLLSGLIAYQFLAATDDRPVVAVQQDLPGKTEVRNDLSSPKLVRLPDNTSVTLDPGSALMYYSDFGHSSRKIRLSGSAFFEVSRDTIKPFFVFAGKTVTQVLGTSFTVRHHRSDLEVAVLTGKVKIGTFTGTMESSISFKAFAELTSNQKVIFNEEQDRFVTVPVKAKITSKKLADNAFYFEDTPLIEVAEVLESAYGINIEIRNEKVKSCPVRADLKGQALFTKLDIICAALNAHYDIKGKTIVITGGQCE